MRIVLFSVGFFFLSSVSVLAQNLPDNSVPGDSNSSMRERQVQQTEPPAEYDRTRNPERRVKYERQGISLSYRRSIPFKMSVNKEQKLRRAPDALLLAKYADFLKQEHTGLIKLFPDVGCEANANLLRADENCVDWIPNSAFYSFRKKEHTSEFLSDITYKNGFLVTDGMLSQGILTAAGDIPLEDISLSSEGMQFLADYQPEEGAKEAFRQFIQISRGIKDGQFEYRKAVHAFENMTYLLRVVAYKGHFYTSYHGSGFDMLYGDKRVDVILAFRILRKESANGSITLLWKELERKESPKIIFPKKKDFKRMAE